MYYRREGFITAAATVAEASAADVAFIGLCRLGLCSNVYFLFLYNLLHLICKFHDTTAWPQSFYSLSSFQIQVIIYLNGNDHIKFNKIFGIYNGKRYHYHQNTSTFVDLNTTGSWVGEQELHEAPIGRRYIMLIKIIAVYLLFI